MRGPTRDKTDPSRIFAKSIRLTDKIGFGLLDHYVTLPYPDCDKGAGDSGRFGFPGP